MHTEAWEGRQRNTDATDVALRIEQIVHVHRKELGSLHRGALRQRAERKVEALLHVQHELHYKSLAQRAYRFSDNQ
jgi:hypothetical protein